MIIDYLGTRYCVNCDWLQFSVRLVEPEPEINCPKGYRLELLQGNNIYRNRFILYDEDGRKVLTALWSPYSSVLDKMIMTVQVANWVLYTHDDSFVSDLLENVVCCDYNSCGRLDICLDFEETKEFREALLHLNSGHYYVQGKKEGSSWWHEHDRKSDGFFHKELHCQTWGSPSSEIKWKIYYKSREVGALSKDEKDIEKPWIVEEWKSARMDISKVWRCEVSLSGACCLRYDDKMITLRDCLSGSWLTMVMSDMLERRFVVRINQGRRDGHKNNDARVNFLRLPFDKVHLAWTRPRDIPEPSEAITSLRRLMRCFDDAPSRCNSEVFNIMANAVCDLVSSQRLDEYFERKFGSDPETYFSLLGQTVGLGVVSGTDAPSKMFD